MQEASSLEDWVLRGGGLRFTQLLDALAEAITIRSIHDELVFANQAALEQFKASSIEELRERAEDSMLGSYALYDDQARLLTFEDLPAAKVARHEQADPLLVRALDRETTAIRWWRLRASPMEDVDGELIGVFTVVEDLTAAMTAETRTRVLAESGRTLASSLDYEETLRNVTGVVVPALADWCAVIEVDDELQRGRVSVAPADGENESLCSQLAWFQGEQIDPNLELGNVVRTNRSVFYEKVTDEDLARWAVSAEALRYLKEFDMCSLAIVPMKAPARTTGAMMFISRASRGRLDRDDLDVAEQLGRRAAVAVENARLHAQLADVAETLERSLLPAELPEIPGWEAASLYIPVSSELRIDVGGDFFELFMAGERPFAIIGDIEGKGVEAATLTALMRYGARFAARSVGEPAVILERLDEALRHEVREATCTALCARLEPDRLTLSSAGHPPALIYSGERGGVREAPPPGPLLGAFDDARWEQHEVPVDPGELVLVYTDGVTDTLGGRERVGRDRLRTLLAEYAGRGPAAVLAQLERELRQSSTRSARWDDLAALALARR